MDESLLGKRFAELHVGFAPAGAIATAWSVVGQVVAVVHTSPVWVYGLALMVPAGLVVARELLTAARYSRWLGLFCLLMLSQSAYLAVTGLGVRPLNPGWTSCAVAGLGVLVFRFPRNPALWLALIFATWDAVDPHLIASVAEVAALNVSFVREIGRLFVPTVVQPAVWHGDDVA